MYIIYYRLLKEIIKDPDLTDSLLKQWEYSCWKGRNSHSRNCLPFLRLCKSFKLLLFLHAVSLSWHEDERNSLHFVPLLLLLIEQEIGVSYCFGKMFRVMLVHCRVMVYPQPALPWSLFVLLLTLMIMVYVVVNGFCLFHCWLLFCWIENTHSLHFSG